MYLLTTEAFVTLNIQGHVRILTCSLGGATKVSCPQKIVCGAHNFLSKNKSALCSLPGTER